MSACSKHAEEQPEGLLPMATAAPTVESVGSSPTHPVANRAAPATDPVRKTWPPAGRQEVAIWPHEAPNMKGMAQPPESITLTQGEDLVAGRPYTYIENVNSPTMTVFRPVGRNARVAVVVFPGGGFEGLAIDLEGSEVCDWITTKGVTCVVLKYRVPKSNDQYDSRCKCHRTPKILRSLQDAQRTIKLVRSQAADLGIDPTKIGVIGFSAGGYLVAQTSNMFAAVYKPVDVVDGVSSRPDFAIAVYPGHIWRPPGFKMDPSLHVTNRTPPTLLLQAWDDAVDGVNQSLVYAHALEEAGVSTEVHLFSKGGHAFGLRLTETPITRWPELAEDWLRSIGALTR